MVRTLTLLLLLLPTLIAAQMPDQAFLVDFGPAATATTGLDDRGNTWTNVTDPTETARVTLTSTAGTSSAISLMVTTPFLAAGPESDDLTNPSVDSLQDLAVGSATGDYFATNNSSTFVLAGLDPGSAYQFELFGSAAASRRNTTYTVSGFTGYTCAVQTSSPTNTGKVCASDLVFPDADGQINVTVRVTLGRMGYLNALRLTEFSGVEICPEVDELGIAIMGSSVARGQGAPGDRGYAFQYGQLLGERAQNEVGRNWGITNISVGGNNTVAVLDRWATDLVPLCDRYVVYGLSLANEGIRNRGRAAFNQFRDNMQELIRLARSREMVPVVVGNYSRRDFNATDYAFIQEMNLLIHEWDVPSVNVLGANDNGSGNWVSGYEADLGHPNLAGHEEFFYAFVPSLFDALDAGKGLPVYTDTAALLVGRDVDQEPIVFVPEETIHSFTVTLSFKTSGTGELISFITPAGAGLIAIDDSERLYYSSPGGEAISAVSPVASGAWHTVSLTHYFARGQTLLYLDGDLVEGSVNERLTPKTFAVAGGGAPSLLEVRNLFFHRSGMNAREMEALHNGGMLKSSLEIYAPFDGQAVLYSNPLTNLAQSTNQLTNARLNSTQVYDDPSAPRIYPNPVTNVLSVELPDGAIPDAIEIRGAYGHLVAIIAGQRQLSVAELAPGVYWLRVRTAKGWSRAQAVIRGR